MNVKIHEKFIKRCIEIGKNGFGTTAPNPMVGCVIVYEDQIIGEGFTSPYGGNHAEINAINSVKDKSLLIKSTLYVTLEPCSHFGKTPPCADAIIRFKIPKVVIGTVDTHNKVAGKGIAKLKAAGCEVLTDILEDECIEHHKRFFTFHNKKRPYIILKWAKTSDGFMAPKFKKKKEPVWITNEISRQLVHKWRAEEQSILVGTNTVLEDIPSLTVRDWTGKNPIRIVLDRDLKLSNRLQTLNDEAETIMISDLKNSEEVSPKGKNIEFINWDSKGNFASQIGAVLYKHDINSVIIEGGRQTLQTFIDENLWDEARVFTGAIQFKEGVEAPKFTGTLILEQKIMHDTLNIYVKN